MQRVFFFTVSCVLCVIAQETCIVSRRLPDFAMKLAADSKEKFTRLPAAAQFEGGSCRMGRIRSVSQKLPADTSIQSCTQNQTVVSCLVLNQISDNPDQSTVAWHDFASQTGSKIDTPHVNVFKKETKCGQCDSKSDMFVLDRFLHQHTISSSELSQLSVGTPMRLSTERMLAAYLRNMLCDTPNNCPILSQSLFTWTKGLFLQSLLSQTHVESTMSNLSLVEDRLWKRSWLYCDKNHKCSGNVEQETWMDPKQRKQGCATAMSTISYSAHSPIIFCLLSSKTEKLCQRLTKWREDVRAILCTATGVCPQQHFFYTPSMFDIQNQNFVSTTVRQFYADTKRCSVDTKYEAMMEQRSVNPILTAWETVLEFIWLLYEIFCGKFAILHRR